MAGYRISAIEIEDTFKSAPAQVPAALRTIVETGYSSGSHPGLKRRGTRPARRTRA